MHTLVYTSALTGILLAAMVIYVVWFEGTAFTAKLITTLIILLVSQVLGYLVLRDVKEEEGGRKDGTIAH